MGAVHSVLLYQAGADANTYKSETYARAEVTGNYTNNHITSITRSTAGRVAHI